MRVGKMQYIEINRLLYYCLFVIKSFYFCNFFASQRNEKFLSSNYLFSFETFFKHKAIKYIEHNMKSRSKVQKLNYHSINKIQDKTDFVIYY